MRGREGELREREEERGVRVVAVAVSIYNFRHSRERNV